MNQSTDKNTIIKPFPALTKALRNILYPFVHLLLKTGVTYPQLSALLKEIYVDVADKHFRLDGKEPSQTRLSFLTGVHRKDVKRLHNTDHVSDEPENINVGVKLVSNWINESRYTDKHGKPLLLSLKAKDSPSFDELVKTVCKQNIRSRVILDEWLNIGVVKLNDGAVELCTDAFIPKDDIAQKAFFLGHNISDHLNAAAQNLLSDTPQFFERCVYYDDLSAESIAELQALVEKQGMSTLKIINDRASQLKTRDEQLKLKNIKNETTSSAKNISKKRINVGLYLYHEDQSAKENKVRPLHDLKVNNETKKDN